MKTAGFIALGFFLACALGAASGLVTRSAQGAVDLTPTEVIVAATDLSEGALLADGNTRRLTVPAAYVTDSMIREADLVKLKGRALSFPMSSGDVLTWQHFAPIARFRALERCVLAAHAGVEAAAEERLTQELESLQLAELAPAAPPTPPPGKTVRVVAAAKKLTPDTELTDASLRIVEVPAYMFTESLIIESEKDSLLGARVVEAVQDGDMLNWPLLRRDSVLGANGCVAKLTDAAHEAKAAFAQKSASTFELGEKP